MSLRQESRYPWFEPRLVAVAVISTAVVFSTSIVVGGWKATHGSETPTPKTLEVSAEASRHLTPDHMTWTITVHGRDSDRDSALEKLRANMTTVHTYMTEHGLAEADLTFGQISASREDEQVTNHDSDGNATQDTVPGDFDASQEITIATKDISHGIAVHKDQAIAEDLSDADVGDASCTSDKMDAAQQDVIGQARTNVHAHAKQAIEQYGGASLGRLMTAAIGNANVGSDCSDLVVTANATASYEIE